MIARLAGVFTICMLTTAAAMGPDVEVTPSREPHAASRLARDGDLQAGMSKAVPGFQRLGLKKDYWWVARVAMQAQLPALTASEEDLARPRSALVSVRVSLVVSEWLEAAWAAIRSVLEHGSAWSRERLSAGERRATTPVSARSTARTSGRHG